MLTIRPARPEDISFIASRMRPADVAEVAASCGDTPESALQQSFELSIQPLTAVDAVGKPVCMFGVGRTPDPHVGCVWLLGTEAVDRERVSFLRLSKRLTRQFHAEYPVLMNCVDERNTVHIRWLRWLGYHFLARHPEWGQAKRPFLEFARLQHV